MFCVLFFETYDAFYKALGEVIYGRWPQRRHLCTWATQVRFDLQGPMASRSRKDVHAIVIPVLEPVNSALRIPGLRNLEHCENFEQAKCLKQTLAAAGP